MIRTRSSRYGDKMTKKDFIAIAKSLGAIPSKAAREREVDRMIGVMRSSNERFDESRFRAAVEVAAKSGNRRRRGVVTRFGGAVRCAVKRFGSFGHYDTIPYRGFALRVRAVSRRRDPAGKPRWEVDVMKGPYVQSTSISAQRDDAVLRAKRVADAMHGNRRRFGSASAWTTAETGQRIELHPGMDLWMRGARYGTVVARHRTGKLKVKLDKLSKPIIVAANRVTYL